MSATLGAKFVHGVEITDTVITFDLEKHMKRNKNLMIFTIVLGSLTIVIVGLGLIAIIMAVIQLKQQPIWYLKKSERFLKALSQETGKPVVFLNLPPDLQHYSREFFLYNKPSSPT